MVGRELVDCVRRLVGQLFITRGERKQLLIGMSRTQSTLQKGRRHGIVVLAGKREEELGFYNSTEK
jgi:hypothetical protein